eukprot:CAMPEP_0114548288 /NCGR_PEP_ID=MMETSP0114-20121206/4902_1 /TAXON_ID=31324 /ORGANISM="Goniomonas sp, Strain m" /LENGTH=1386 /DNA_ID=CAMNT_0001732869 /DNA_START=62 /DNA_END=4221 /DNA_ORIENTATION=-
MDFFGGDLGNDSSGHMETFDFDFVDSAFSEDVSMNMRHSEPGSHSTAKTRENIFPSALCPVPEVVVQDDVAAGAKRALPAASEPLLKRPRLLGNPQSFNAAFTLFASTVREVDGDLTSVPLAQFAVRTLCELCLGSATESVRSEAAAALGRLANSERNRVMVGSWGGIQCLVQLCRERLGMAVLEQATNALWQLAQSNENKILMRSCGGLRVLVNLCAKSGKESGLLEQTAGALCCALDHPATHDALYDTDLIPDVVLMGKLVAWPPPPTLLPLLQVCSSTFRALAISGRGWAVFEAGGVDLLLRWIAPEPAPDPCCVASPFAQSQSAEQMRASECALRALRALGSNSAIATYIASPSTLHRLVEMAATPASPGALATAAGSVLSVVLGSASISATSPRQATPPSSRPSAPGPPTSSSSSSRPSSSTVAPPSPSIDALINVTSVEQMVQMARRPPQPRANADAQHWRMGPADDDHEADIVRRLGIMALRVAFSPPRSTAETVAQAVAAGALPVLFQVAVTCSGALHPSSNARPVLAPPPGAAAPEETDLATTAVAAAADLLASALACRASVELPPVAATLTQLLLASRALAAGARPLVVECVRALATGPGLEAVLSSGALRALLLLIQAATPGSAAADQASELVQATAAAVTQHETQRAPATCSETSSSSDPQSPTAAATKAAHAPTTSNDADQWGGEVRRWSLLSVLVETVGYLLARASPYRQLSHPMWACEPRQGRPAASCVSWVMKIVHAAIKGVSAASGSPEAWPMTTTAAHGIRALALLHRVEANRATLADLRLENLLFRCADEAARPEIVTPALRLIREVDLRGRLSAAKLADLLLRLLRDPSQPITEEAAESLLALGNPEILSSYLLRALLPAARSPEFTAAYRSALASPQRVEALVATVTSSQSYRVQAACVDLLAPSAASPQALCPPLQSLCASPSPEVATVSARAALELANSGLAAELCNAGLPESLGVLLMHAVLAGGHSSVAWSSAIRTATLALCSLAQATAPGNGDAQSREASHKDEATTHKAGDAPSTNPAAGDGEPLRCLLCLTTLGLALTLPQAAAGPRSDCPLCRSLRRVYSPSEADPAAEDADAVKPSPPLMLSSSAVSRASITPSASSFARSCAISPSLSLSLSSLSSLPGDATTPPARHLDRVDSRLAAAAAVTAARSAESSHLRARMRESRTLSRSLVSSALSDLGVAAATISGEDDPPFESLLARRGRLQDPWGADNDEADGAALANDSCSSRARRLLARNGGLGWRGSSGSLPLLSSLAAAQPLASDEGGYFQRLYCSLSASRYGEPQSGRYSPLLEHTSSLTAAALSASSHAHSFASSASRRESFLAAVRERAELAERELASAARPRLDDSDVWCAAAAAVG